MKRSIQLFFALIGLVITLGACSGSKNVKKDGLSSKNTTELSQKDEIQLKNLFFEASREKALSNYAAAQKYYEQCLSIDPNHSASIYELSSIYQSQSRFADAVLFMERAVSLEPQNKWFLQSLAILYEQTKQYEKGSEIYARLIEVNPKELSYYEGEARMFLFQNDLKKAIKVYDKIEERFGVLEPVIMQKQQVLLGVKKYDLAIAEAQKLVDSAPGTAKYYNNLADVYRKAGQKEKATETYKKLLELDPDNAFVQLSMATYYLEDGNTQKGEDLLRKAFRNPKLDFESKGRILLNNVMKQDQSTGMVDDFTFELIDSMKFAHPQNAQIHAIEADLLFQSKLVDKSLAAYKRSLALDSNQFLIWNRILFIHSDQENWLEMYTDGMAAIDLFPNQGTLYYLAGIGAYQMKNYKGAIKVLETGKDFILDNNQLLVQLFSTLGDAYHSLEDHKNSDANFDKCLELEPDNIAVLNNYSYYLSLRGEKLELAKSMSKKTIEKEPTSAIYLDTYAWILFMNKEYEEAKKYMEVALNNGGNQQGVLVEHYGDILYRLNDIEGAMKHWKMAQEMGDASDKIDEKIKKKTYIP